MDRISDTEREEDKVTQFGHLLGPQRRNKGHFPIGIGGRASQRSSRRPSSARIGRDREMRISSAAPCAARGAPLQPKIGLPYQLYVSAPRAKFGSLGWRVGCARCPVTKTKVVRYRPSRGVPGFCSGSSGAASKIIWTKTGHGTYLCLILIHTKFEKKS